VGQATGVEQAVLAEQIGDVVLVESNGFKFCCCGDPMVYARDMSLCGN